MADADGAVRRTPRPYPSSGDHEAPVPTPSAAACATNTGDPVSQDAGTATGELSGPWADPVGTVREHDDGTTAVKVSMGNDTGKGQHVWCWMTPQLEVRWLDHYEVAEWATEREARLAALRATLAADPGALFQVGHVHDTSNDMQAFLELPDCLACGGTGKDDHATPFEQPLAVHFAGPPIRAEGRQRQLCMWCGHVLTDIALTRDTEPPEWPVSALIKVEDGVLTVVPHEPGTELPDGCCALTDEGQPVCICTVESTPCPDCRDDDQTDDDEPVDPDDGYPVDLCGKHTGTCSNRCLLAAHHDGECDDDPGPDEAPPCSCKPERCDRLVVNGQCQHCARLGPGQGCPAEPWCDEHGHPALTCTYCDTTGEIDESGPDHAQETHAAADQPAEPVDTHADEVDHA